MSLHFTNLEYAVGLKEYYTDSKGVTVENPKFLRIGEKVLKRSVRRVSTKVKGSKNRSQARLILGKRHLKISRQRKDHAVKLAGVRNLIQRCSRLGRFENQKHGEESLFS